jgi:ABC-type lipopolysaccharide export system ATPase subunit
MFEGGILKAGVPEELEDEMVRRVYLGQILN